MLKSGKYFIAKFVSTARAYPCDAALFSCKLDNDWRNFFSGDKHSSLFSQIANDKVKKFYIFVTWLSSSSQNWGATEPKLPEGKNDDEMTKWPV
jgi:hypothetical protein